jgi:cell shape-determining protein MreC
MKMNYLLKSSSVRERKKQNTKKNLFILVFLLLIILVLSVKPVRNSLFFISSPIWKLQNSISNSNFFQYFKFKSSLINEKIFLEQQLFLAGEAISLNGILQEENNLLKSLLERQDTNLNTTLAVVLAKPPQTIYDLLIIDIGGNKGVRVGDKVMANGHVYIGEIEEVFPSSAKVRLYSSPGQKLSVALGQNAISVEAVGLGGGNFHILLPKEIEVREGDGITIPAINSNVFGIVEKVNNNDQDSLQKILFKSPVNISELRFVEVVL